MGHTRWHGMNEVTLFRQRPQNMMCHKSYAYFEIISCNITPFVKERVIGNNVEFKLGVQISEK